MGAKQDQNRPGNRTARAATGPLGGRYCQGEIDRSATCYSLERTARSTVSREHGTRRLPSNRCGGVVKLAGAALPSEPVRQQSSGGPLTVVLNQADRRATQVAAGHDRRILWPTLLAQHQIQGRGRLHVRRENALMKRRCQATMCTRGRTVR